ncbi:hypothetical protein FNF29_05005 [Cafeteria roenbergensis]|nr:hypothetical protein FNF29_05005 [Cafeteria roenbergensis]KAA0154821.1 hypothetical protein FNF31_06240 [Cafeteria roenbergensis]KAA0160798.1 hypothetical protein FNF28_05322 [Cafeteria roenbergensis]|eukprot:KAA0150891.1 hypothetical protein FNF29_05005 [Cafeteria roenbergensis]
MAPGEFATFTLFDEETTTALLRAVDEAEIKETLLATAAWEPASRASVVVELLFYALATCREADMDARKASVVLAIVLDRVRADAGAFSTTASGSAAAFQAQLRRHSVQRPPQSVGILSVADASTVLDWFTTTYLRSFHLYKHALAARPTLVFRQRTAGDVPPPRKAPPLCQAHQVS